MCVVRCGSHYPSGDTTDRVKGSHLRPCDQGPASVVTKRESTATPRFNRFMGRFHMVHQRRIALATLIVGAAISGACDGHNPVSPTATSPAATLTHATAKDSSGGTTTPTPATPTPAPPADSTAHRAPPPTKPSSPPATPPADSAGVPSYSGTVVIHGQAVTLRAAPAQSTSDTLIYQPVPGAAISLIANATSQSVATAVTVSDGSFSFTVPAGAYRIVGHSPTGSGAGDGSVLVSAAAGTIYTQLILPSTP